MPDLYNPQDLNRFSYVRNNPVRYNDPTGHFCSDPEDPSPSCDGSGTPPPVITPPPAPAPVVIINPDPLDDGQEQDDPTPSPIPDKTLPIPPLSTAETIGLVATGVLLAVTATVVEFTLLYFGFVLLSAGPIGLIVDLAVIVPVELFIIDVEIGVEKYISDVVASGTREGHEPEFILIPIVKDLLGN